MPHIADYRIREIQSHFYFMEPATQHRTSGERLEEAMAAVSRYPVVLAVFGMIACFFDSLRSDNKFSD